MRAAGWPRSPPPPDAEAVLRGSRARRELTGRAGAGAGRGAGGGGGGPLGSWTWQLQVGRREAGRRSPLHPSGRFPCRHPSRLPVWGSRGGFQPWRHPPPLLCAPRLPGQLQLQLPQPPTRAPIPGLVVGDGGNLGARPPQGGVVPDRKNKVGGGVKGGGTNNDLGHLCTPLSTPCGTHGEQGRSRGRHLDPVPLPKSLPDVATRGEGSRGLAWTRAAPPQEAECVGSPLTHGRLSENRGSWVISQGCCSPRKQALTPTQSGPPLPASPPPGAAPTPGVLRLPSPWASRQGFQKSASSCRFSPSFPKARLVRVSRVSTQQLRCLYLGCGAGG